MTAKLMPTTADEFIKGTLRSCLEVSATKQPKAKASATISQCYETLITSETVLQANHRNIGQRTTAASAIRIELAGNKSKAKATESKTVPPRKVTINDPTYQSMNANS
jgi:hypothetical protein